MRHKEQPFIKDLPNLPNHVLGEMTREMRGFMNRSRTNESYRYWLSQLTLCEKEVIRRMELMRQQSA
jgi:hypothetical protein